MTITASDGQADGIVRQNVTIQVTDVNDAPRFSVAPVLASLSESAKLSIPYDTFMDEDDDPLSYSATLTTGDPLPSWLEFQSTTREFALLDMASATPQLNVLLIVDDGRGGVAETELVLSFEPPVAAATDTSGSSANFELPEFVAVAPEVIQPTPVTEPIDTVPVDRVIVSNLPTFASTEIDEVDLQSLIAPIPRLDLSANLGDRNSEASPTGRPEFATSLTDIDTIDLADLLSMSSLDISSEYGSLVDAFDDQRDELAEELSFAQSLMGGTVGVASGFSVGYLIWLIRGGTLMGSMLSSLPAWRFVDPLPVLGSLGDQDNDDGESLETMVDRQPSPAPDEQDRQGAAAQIKDRPRPPS
ncbi:MAG: hypothetical protein HKN42_02525 [Granulosicoccus sp.]|nr:hypothetical protein [Granulosicoccus sp.]